MRHIPLLLFHLRERLFDAGIWVRDAYLHLPGIRATIDSTVLLVSLLGIDHALDHPLGLRLVYVLPIWLAAKRGGRIPGYVACALSAIGLFVLDLDKGMNPDRALVDVTINLMVSAGLMAFIEHFESSLRRIHRLATRDPLTQLLNRSGFNLYFERTKDRALAQGQGFLVAHIDLDNFKRANDTRGHEYGDHILKTLGRLLRRHGQGVVCCRLGGDEFAVATQSMSRTTFQEYLSKVRSKFEESVGEASLGVSMSFGIATLGPDGMTLEEVLRTADLAMYEQKSQRKQALTMVQNRRATDSANLA